MSTVFSLVYGAEHLKVSRNLVVWGVAVAGLIGLVTIPFYGAWSDPIGRRPLYLAGATFSLLFAFPFFWLMNTKVIALIWLAIILGVNVGHDLMYGPQAAYFAELFGTRVRYSGASLGYQLASVFAGGFAPLVAAALLDAVGYPAVAIYMAVMALITIVSTYLTHETFKEDIYAQYAAERELVRERESRDGARGANLGRT
jgi:MHS family shikimate/dehydroshikimate transporter-like MFS transporter